MSESPPDPLFARLIVTTGYLIGRQEHEFAAAVVDAVERIYGKDAAEQLRCAAENWKKLTPRLGEPEPF